MTVGSKTGTRSVKVRFISVRFIVAGSGVGSKAGEGTGIGAGLKTNKEDFTKAVFKSKFEPTQ